MSSVPERSKNAQQPGPAIAYSGYGRTAIPKTDDELTLAGPSTPLGEYVRRFWQPVCMSSQLRDVPLAIRILNEDLVAFRDGSGEVAVMHRHCCHRGASLEYGIVQEHGIRCCYHGMHFAPDGTILDAPAEKDGGKRISAKLTQGAYPAFERDGLVFAYMGPPEHRPPFIEYDAFEKYDDTRLVAFSNVFPCNWLQTMDNISDQMHTSILHNPKRLYDREIPENLDWESYTLASFAAVPVLDYVAVRGGTAMAWIAGRRMSDERVWIRMNELIVPNISQHAYLFEKGAKRNLFHRVHMSRWYVPVDDTHSIIYGWRMFGKTIDPERKGDESKVGWDKMDFLDGQVGHRTYEDAQRMPGDWEAIVGQRPIAIHALENPLESDIGVFTLRKLVREAIRNRNPAADPVAMHERARNNKISNSYTQNTVLEIRRRPSEDEDRNLIKWVGRAIVDVMAEADSVDHLRRRDFVIARISELEKTAATK